MPAGDVLFAWPGWGVQQDLGPLQGTVGTFRIFVSAEPGGDALTVRATLVDAATREVVRAWSIEATPGYTPVARTLAFPEYSVPEDQRLLLQLQVADFEHNYAIFALASPRPGFANLMLNGVADSGGGPLAFAQVETGSGLRAALAGAPAERIRLVLAGSFMALAILAYPRVAGAFGKAATGVRRLARRPVVGALRPHGSRTVTDSEAMAASGGFLSAPWYPWPIAMAPILHFLATNHLLFAAVEAIFPLAVALVVVTGAVISLRLVLKDWHRPAAATVAVVVVVFAYGHVENALDRRIDERVLFPVAIVLLVVAVAAALRANVALARSAPFLNLVAVTLLAFPTAALVNVAVDNFLRNSSGETTAMDDHLAQLLSSIPTPSSEHRPDIYYIVFDEYARNDELAQFAQFDNTDFLRELQRRGFYVATEGTSNYRTTRQSIPSLLNMSYLDDLGPRTRSGSPDLFSMARHHRVGMILKKLGYTYVHLASGYEYTNKSPLADVIVHFTPSGILFDDVYGGYRSELSPESLLVGRFLRELIQTTLLRPILGHLLAPGGSFVYPWWHPARVLQMFDFLTNPIDVDGPKFVFAHIGKPHLPATFDRHGNAVPGINVHDAFRDDHDRSVPSPYIGQLIYLNSRILEMVDGISQHGENDTIIIISGDHGLKVIGRGASHDILAAFRLPDGGDRRLYPSISSVNHFRVILDFYFGLGIGLLEDRHFVIRHYGRASA